MLSAQIPTLILLSPVIRMLWFGLKRCGQWQRQVLNCVGRSCFRPPARRIFLSQLRRSICAIMNVMLASFQTKTLRASYSMRPTCSRATSFRGMTASKAALAPISACVTPVISAIVTGGFMRLLDNRSSSAA